MEPREVRSEIEDTRFPQNVGGFSRAFWVEPLARKLDQPGLLADYLWRGLSLPTCAVSSSGDGEEASAARV